MALLSDFDSATDADPIRIRCTICEVSERRVRCFRSFERRHEACGLVLPQPVEVAEGRMIRTREGVRIIRSIGANKRRVRLLCGRTMRLVRVGETKRGGSVAMKRWCRECRDAAAAQVIA